MSITNLCHSPIYAMYQTSEILLKYYSPHCEMSMNFAENSKLVM